MPEIYNWTILDKKPRKVEEMGRDIGVIEINR